MKKSLNPKIFPSAFCGILSDCMVKLCHILDIIGIIDVKTSKKESQTFLAKIFGFAMFNLPP